MNEEGMGNIGGMQDSQTNTKTVWSPASSLLYLTWLRWGIFKALYVCIWEGKKERKGGKGKGGGRGSEGEERGRERGGGRKREREENLLTHESQSIRKWYRDLYHMTLYSGHSSQTRPIIGQWIFQFYYVKSKLWIVSVFYLFLHSSQYQGLSKCYLKMIDSGSVP